MQKTILAALVVLSSMLTLSASSAEEVTTKEMGIGVLDAYVPMGLKTTQDSFIVVTGLFPNSCYSFSGAEVNNNADFVHKIRTVVKVQSGICQRVITPFSQQISLGKLMAGEHKVQLVADDDTYFEKTFIVTK